MRWIDYILEETTVPKFHIIFTANYNVTFKIFWNQTYYFKAGQIAISEWGSFDNLLFQSGPSVISKWAETVLSKWVKVYFKMGKIFKSGAKVISKWGSYFKVGENVISRWGSYFKVGQLFQSGASHSVKLLWSCI